MKVLIEPGKTKNVIATLAIGDEYYQSWIRFAFPTWKKYCERYELGLIVCDTDLVQKESNKWKKRQWQKLLIGEYLKHNFSTINNVCYLDTDILINYIAPNVFDFYNSDTIGLVSLDKNLPYSRNSVLRRIAFLRHNYYDINYPLDSALFMSLKQVFEFHRLEIQEDYACTGFFIFNVAAHSEIMSTWFSKYDCNIESITDGGEQTHLNFELQNWGKISWLDYKFQALWLYEIAWKYPFLYDFGRNQKVLIRECIEASLFTNYFLHFAGSWYESDMWKADGILESSHQQKKFEEFSEYEKIPVTGEPKGVIKPKLN